jgi:hydrogenase/urease accessory protein HupE
MNRITKVALAANLLVISSVPALAHPGHGFENPVLHRIHHWLGGLDPAWAALAAGILALALVAALYVRSRRANRR